MPGHSYDPSIKYPNKMLIILNRSCLHIDIDGYRVFIELFRFFTGNGIITNDIDCALKINPTACDMMRD